MEIPVYIWYNKNDSNKGCLLMKQRIISFLLCFGLLFAFTACNDDTAGSIIYYPVYQTMKSCDPQVAVSDVEKIIVYNCFEGLVRMNADGEIRPAAASNWTVSDDGKTYTFSLRRDAKWNVSSYAVEALQERLPENFSPGVTADDFVFALQRAVDPNTGAPEAPLLYSIENARNIHNGLLDVSVLGVEAVDDYTLVIRLSEPQSNFLQVLTECICMPCNRTFFEACAGRYGLLVRRSMYNGPFRLYQFTDTIYTLLASDVYTGQHKPRPTRVYLYYNANGEKIPEKMSDGIYSGAYLTDSMYAKTTVQSDSTVTEINNTTVCLLFNMQNEKTQNSDFRRAICLATDARQMAALAEKEYCGSLLPSVCNFVPAVEPDYNEEKALQSLWSGLENTEADSVSLTVLVSEEYTDLLKRQLQNWQKTLGLGCAVRVESVSEAQLKNRVLKGEYEIAFYPLTASAPDTLRFLEQFTPGSTNNALHLENAAYTGLLNAAKTASDTATQRKYLSSAVKYLTDNYCIIPVFSESAYLLQTEGVQGIFCDASPERIFFENAYTVQ